MSDSSWSPEYSELWPTPDRELLLRAASSQGQASADAFQAWKSAAGFEHYEDIDWRSCRILPLVYKSLSRSGIDDPWQPRLRALHRYQWATIKSKQRRLIRIAKRFDAAQIAWLVLKGHALIAGGYYDDAGERPLHDIDLLIRPEDLDAAGGVLESMGWIAHGSGPHAEPHAWLWKDPENQELDLHVKMLPPPYAYIGYADLAPQSQVAHIDGVPVRIPDATDLLLHCLVHGRLHWGDPEQPFLWVPDALRILQRAPHGIDWARLRDNALRFATLFDVRESLGYLRAHFDAEVPESWLAECREIPISRQDLIPFFRWTNRHEKHSVLELIDLLGADFRCHQQMRGRPQSRLHFIKYLAARMKRLVSTPAGRQRIRRLREKCYDDGLLDTLRRPTFLDAT